MLLAATRNSVAAEQSAADGWAATELAAGGGAAGGAAAAEVAAGGRGRRTAGAARDPRQPDDARHGPQDDECQWSATSGIGCLVRSGHVASGSMAGVV